MAMSSNTKLKMFLSLLILSNLNYIFN